MLLVDFSCLLMASDCVGLLLMAGAPRRVASQEGRVPRVPHARERGRPVATRVWAALWCTTVNVNAAAEVGRRVVVHGTVRYAANRLP